MEPNYDLLMLTKWIYPQSHFKMTQWLHVVEMVNSLYEIYRK